MGSSQRFDASAPPGLVSSPAAAAAWIGRFPEREPVCTSKGPIPLGRQKSPEQQALAGLRVLVVEDDTDGRELMMTVLVGAGAEVEMAACVAEGFEALRTFHPQLLVSDIAMPDEDGYSLIRRVRALSIAEGGAIPAIALSAFNRPEDRIKALSAGFSLHIGKPVEPAVLVSALRRLVEQAGAALGKRSCPARN